MALGIAAVKDWELRQLDVDTAYLEANVKEELYIELPEDYRNSCDQRREDQHHAGSSGSKTPVQERCPIDRGGDGRNVCHPLPGGGRGPHVGCEHDPP